MITFKHAVNGLVKVFSSEKNFRIHLIVMILVITAGLLLSIKTNEWLILILTFISVCVTEIINTALEYLCDFVSPQYNDKIKAIKDISAGAVLLTAAGSVAVGLIIFLPKLSGIFSFLIQGFH